MADDKPTFMVLHSPSDGCFMLVGPHFVVTGFETRTEAHDWLTRFFDTNVRRTEDLAMEAKMDKERLALEREEMLIRSLEPKEPQ